MEFKVKQQLTIPLLKLEVGKTQYIKVTGAMFVGKEIKSRRNAAPTNREPATLIRAVNLQTGEQCEVICSAVMKGIFEDKFPEDAYVGKCFSITKLEKREGKEYNGFKMDEIEDPTPAEKHGKK